MKYKLIPTLEIWEETIKELEVLGWLGNTASHWNLRNMWDKYKENTAILWTPEWSLLHKKDNEILE